MRSPRVVIIDKLASYGAAKTEIMPAAEHRGTRTKAFQVWAEISRIAMTM
jgi:transposase-like protein